MVIQIFSDDISAAIGHADRAVTIELAHVLIKVLLQRLRGTDLDVSIPKCSNFLVEGALQATREGPVETIRNLKRQLKEMTRQRMSQDLGVLESQAGKNGEEELPFPWKHSFKLLGVILDSRWRFREQFREVQKKPKRGYI